MASAKEWNFWDFVFLIFFMLVVVSAYSPTLATFADAVPAPPTSCKTDLQCNFGMFCRSNGFCATCVDCANQHRQPAPHGCAKGSSECGPCEIGYKEEADHCTDNEEQNSAATAAVSQNSGSPVQDKRSEQANSDKDGAKPSNNVHFYWLFGVLTVVTVTALGFGIAYFSCGKGNSRHRRFSGSGEKGPGEDDQSDGLTTQAPSAPLLPEEYNSPPPYASASGKNVLSSGNYKSPMHQFVNPNIMELVAGHSREWHLPHQTRVVQNLVAASPFNAGNGAGEWANAQQNPEDNQNQATDNDAGAAAVPPPLEDNTTDNNVVAVAVEVAGILNPIPIQDEPANQINIPMLELGPQDIAELNEENDPDEEIELNMMEVQGEEEYQQVDPNELFFDFGFHLEIHIEHTLPLPILQRLQGNSRSQSANGVDVDDTVMDFSTLANSSFASSSTSFSQSAEGSGDSGTGTSNEDDHPPHSPPHRVPSMSDDVPIASSNLDNDDDGGLYGDDPGFDLEDIDMGDEE